MKTSPLRTIERLSMASLLFIFGCLGLSKADAANILFVVNSPDTVDPTAPSNANDFEVATRLRSQGHTVTVADDQDPALGDLFAGKDLILISSSVGSGNQPLNSLSISTLRTGRIPIVNYEPGLYDELLFQRENTFGNAGGHTSLAISVSYQSHPLAAGKSGTIDIVDPGNSAVVSSSALPYTVGTNAIIIATNATVGVNEGRICIWAYEKGSHLADDNTVVLGRRVAFFYNATTPPATYNTNATALFDAAIAWALQPPQNLPILVLFRSPPTQNAAPDAPITVELEDGSSKQVNTNSISLSLNGTAVAPTITKSGTITTVSFTPSTIFPAASSNSVRLIYSDNSSPAQTFTNTFQFTVENYVTIPPDRKLTSVDTTKPGFLLKLRLLPNGVTRPVGNTVATAILQLEDAFIDPATGQPYADQINRAATGNEPGAVFNPDGTFTEPTIINFNEAAGGTDQGVFRSPTWPDEQTPGVPGLDSGQDYYVMLASTILDLKAGLYRMGVNSDDGFVVTSDDPRDVFTAQSGTAGDRGQATTLFHFVVQEAGFYPFHLIWWESTGGSECEWFIVDRTTGEQMLINDLANTNLFQASPVKAYRPATAAAARPYVRSVNPTPSATSVATNTTIGVTIVDGAAKVVTNSIQLLLNGATLAPSITQASGVTTISATPPGVLPFLSSNNVTLMFSDNGTPALTRTNAWSFTVESPLPKVLFVVATGALNASDTAAKARLESVLGFEVVAVGDTASQSGDANRKALILISATVGSGNVNTKFRDMAVPILNWEPAIEDALLAAPLPGVTAANQTQIEIANATHPLAAGFPAGPLTVLNPAQSVNYTDPNANAIIVARLADATIGNSPVIFVFPKGTDMEPDPTTGLPFKAPEKRVGFFLNNDSFANLTPQGLKLFDAAVQWTSGITNTVSPQPKFDPPVLSGNQVTLSWTGTGNLEQTDSLSPPNWGPAPSQANPQVVPATGTRFYRIRQ